MNRSVLLVLMVVLLVKIPASARAYDGVWQADFFGENMTLKLKASSKGQVRGTLSLSMFEPGTGRSETLVFVKSGSAPARQASAKPDTKAAGTGKVIINGTALTNKQIQELERKYKVKPITGKYWYDGRSGLYGVVGYGF
jgi:hypothetical protein